MSSRRKKKEPIEIDGPEFECYFQELHEFPSVNMNSLESGDSLKPVRYHGSMFWGIKGFGVSRWVLGGYIVVDWRELRDQGYSDEEIYKGCVKYLNKPPKRKKFQRRISRPLFGNLSPEPVKVAAREKFGKRVLEVLAVTDKRKLRSAWGEGTTLPSRVKKRSLV